MNDSNRSKRMEGWYWCRLRQKNDWTICRWSGSNWYAADYPLERPPAIIDTECLHEPLADDDPSLQAAALRAETILSQAEELTEARAEIRRLRDCILSARWRLTKGRALWNGPCHECDAALERGLTGKDVRAAASDLELSVLDSDVNQQ